MDIRAYLSEKNILWKEVHRPSGINAIMNCPFCSPPDMEKKFSINLQTGVFNCLHLNRCGVKGSWYDFQRLFKDDPKPLNGNASFASKKPAKQYVKPKNKNFVLPTANALRFLLDRGFNEAIIEKYKVAMTEDGTTIALPYFKNGKLVNVKYRALDKKEMWQEKQAEPVLFNRDNIPSTNQSLIITEGEFDALALCQYGIDAVSIPCGVNNMEWIENEWEWLDRFKEIILCFDMDDAGQGAIQQVVKRLGEWRCKRVELPYKDANECLKKNVPAETMLSVMLDAKDFEPIVLKSAEFFVNEVLDLFWNTRKIYGSPTLFTRLDNILGGWRMSELTVWSGNNSAGKSTILNQMVVDLVEKHINCCVASLEMPVPRYLRWACIQSIGKACPAKQEIIETMEFLGKHLYVVNVHEEIDIDSAIDVFKYAARRYGCKHFVIDSLMRIKINLNDELKEQKNVCTKLVSFAKEFDVHIHLVAHPRKGYDDDTRPGKVDVMGTGHITNLAHNVIIIWRPSEELKEEMKKKSKEVMDAKLYIKKNRELGTEGSMKLWFDSNTKKFREEEIW